MSIAELKKTADALNARERRWLRAYLVASERSESDEWKKRIVEKKQALLAGRGVGKPRTSKGVREQRG